MAKLGKTSPRGKSALKKTSATRPPAGTGQKRAGMSPKAKHVRIVPSPSQTMSVPSTLGQATPRRSPLSRNKPNLKISPRASPTSAMNLSVSRREALRARANTPMAIDSPCAPKLSPRMAFRADLTPSKSFLGSFSATGGPASPRVSSPRGQFPRHVSTSDLPMSPRQVIPGTSTYLQEEYKQAVEEQMATNNPMHSMLHLNYALLLENTATTIDQLEMADKYYEKAVDIGIDEQQNRVDVVPHVALNRAHMLYHRLRDIPRAEKWYRLALSREPENAACAYALAQFSYCVALENYHKRTRKLLYSSTPVVLTARDFRAKNGLEETKRLFKKVKKDLSKDPEVLFIVACFHRELGEVDAARQLFKRSLKNSDKESIVNVEPFATTPFYRKQVYATFLVDHVMPKEEDEECKLELKERALELLKGARVESENAPITILKHATILIKMQEDSEKIERCFNFVMKKNGTSSSNFYWRYSDFLWKCVGESRYEDARAMYEQALELERQRPKAWREMQYAMFLWKKNEGAKKETLACKNDFKGAYEHFVKANDLDPNNPELLRHFSQFLLGVYNDKKIAFGLYFNSLKARPGDYDLAMGCASYMKEIKSWRKADYAFGRACSIVDNVGFEGTEEERVAAHYEYGLFLIKVRQQFRRAHDHFIIAGKHDGVVDLYNEGQTMFDKVETLYKTGLIGARENEIMDINNQITLENETPQPKGQKGKKVKKDLLDSAQDKTIYRYRKGLADFLDRVANKPEDSLQQLFLCQVQRADKDVLYTLARVKVKTDDFLGAFTFLEKSIDAGFKDVVMFESDPELTQLKDGSKEGGDSEKYMECLTRVKVPPSQRDINVGASKMVKGRKKKKGK